MSERLFVYGILKGRFSDAERAELPGYKKFYRGHATISKDSGELVEGELISVDDFEELDRIEGVEYNYYHRFKTMVYNVERECYEEAWVYQQALDRE